ncbi:MAG: GntR family transcriptional regulator [Verrucomicrobiota bacterium]
MPRQPIFTKVADKLRECIENGEYERGSPLPAERVLAEQYGVNRLTLRKALDLLHSKGVVERRKGRGTFVAYEARHPDTVLYMGPTSAHFYQGFYSALCAEAQSRRQAVTAFTPEENDEQTIEQFRRFMQNHHHLVCTDHAWRHLKDAVPRDVHVIRISGLMSVGEVQSSERPCHIVSTDAYRAAKLAVEHLIGLGHRRIGCIDYGRIVEDQMPSGRLPSRADAYLGYRSALNEAEITEQYPIAIPNSPKDKEEFLDWHCQCLRGQFEHLPHLPTAFICVGDFRAAPLLRVLRERGLSVPKDVSVIGMGNTPWAEALDPPLTSVCLGEAEMARLALMFINETETTIHRVVRVDPELVVRQSTANINESRS